VDAQRFHPHRLALALILALIVLSAASTAFAVPSEETPLIRFGLMTDLHAHDIDSPLEGKWMAHTEERIHAFTDAMNAWDPDFVIELGDFINGWVVLGADPGDPARIPEVLAWAQALYQHFTGPRYHVVGNHDLYNLDKEQLREILGMDALYYSFDVGAVHFVVLDVQYAENGSDLAHTYTGVAGFVPEFEIAWLRHDLAGTEATTIIFVHQMLDKQIEEWGRPLIANQAEVHATLVAAGNVIAVFQGHDHDNGYSVSDGIHYITFEALVDQGTLPSWAQITVDTHARTLLIEGVGNQANYALDY